MKYPEWVEKQRRKGTNIISNSAHMNINRVDYNSHRYFDPQINLMMAFSTNICQAIIE